MRVDVFTGGIKNQGISYLYLTDEEISRYGLEPTNYEGKIYDWITLPERDAHAEPGEHLVAAYGGYLSAICCSQPEINIYKVANVCFYTLPGWDESGFEEELDYLPSDLREKLCSAIREHCGTYNIDEFEKPFFDGDHWVEANEIQEQSFMSLSEAHKIINEQEGVWLKNDNKKHLLEPDETLKYTFGDFTYNFGIFYSEKIPVTKLICGKESEKESFETQQVFDVKGNTDVAKQVVGNIIKHFHHRQDIGLFHIGNYITSQINELYHETTDFFDEKELRATINGEQEGVWIKNYVAQDSPEPDETLRRTFGNTPVRFDIRYPDSYDDPVTTISINDIKYDLNGNPDKAENIVNDTINNFDKSQNIEVDIISGYLGSKIMEANIEADIKNPHSHKAQLTIDLAKQAGYVQGVCECIVAIGNDHTLEKKLLSEMNVTKDMAKKFANPETFKALEQGIFAQEPAQKFGQTHSLKL